MSAIGLDAYLRAMRFQRRAWTAARAVSAGVGLEAANFVCYASSSLSSWSLVRAGLGLVFDVLAEAPGGAPEPRLPAGATERVSESLFARGQRQNPAPRVARAYRHPHLKEPTMPDTATRESIYQPEPPEPPEPPEQPLQVQPICRQRLRTPPGLLP